jgi:hypothetical protein
MAVIVIGLWACWFAVSALTQFVPPRWDETLRAWDVFSLLPRWTFFAPNPGVSDFHLLYRDRLANGTFGPWTEIPLEDRNALGKAFWNPRKRKGKLLSDAVRGLIRIAALYPATGYKTTMPYLVILNFIASLPRWPLTTGTQFLNMESFGFFAAKPPRVVFRSEMHRLGHDGSQAA